MEIPGIIREFTNFLFYLQSDWSLAVNLFFVIVGFGLAAPTRNLGNRKNTLDIRRLEKAEVEPLQARIKVLEAKLADHENYFFEKNVYWKRLPPYIGSPYIGSSL